jgi:hypothetical protein
MLPPPPHDVTLGLATSPHPRRRAARAIACAAALACALGSGCGAVTDIDITEAVPAREVPDAGSEPPSCTTPKSGPYRCGDWVVWKFPASMGEYCVKLDGGVPSAASCAALCGSNLRAADESWSCKWSSPYLTCTAVCPGRR